MEGKISYQKLVLSLFGAQNLLTYYTRDFQEVCTSEFQSEDEIQQSGNQPLMNVLQVQETNLCYYKSLRFWSCLLMQHNLPYSDKYAN